MSDNMLWIRILAQAGIALAFSALTVVAMWLLLRRYVGHRRLLIAAAVFFTLNSFRAISLVIGLYVGNPSGAVTVFSQVFAAVYGIGFCGMVMNAMPDVLRTLTGTEASEMVKQDREKDELQKWQLFKFMAEENKQKSLELLTETVSREARING